MSDARIAPAHPRSLMDGVSAVALFVVTTGYAVAWPRSLGPSDEAMLLYEAVRILSGEVFYRDIFDLLMPGSHYLMAGIFWVFGPDMATARIATAIMHGLTSVLVYLVCRAFAVRRSLAFAAGLTQAALFWPAWPYASYHWVSTLLQAMLLYALAVRTAGAVLPGLLVGGMIMVQQQHGAVVALTVVAIMVADHLAARPTAGGAAALLRRLAAFTGGVALVTVPCIGALMAAAGVEQVWRATVLQPLFDYANFHHSFAGIRWAFIDLGTHEQSRHTVPLVLRWLPSVLIVDVARAAVAWRRGEIATVRRLLLLALFALGAMGSIGHYPDFIHVAFIAGFLVVAAAENVEWVLGRLAARPHLDRIVGRAIAVAVVAALGFHMRAALLRSRATYSVAYMTPFGRIDMPPKAWFGPIDQLRSLLDTLPSRELFVYSTYPALYLLAGGRNPTPYQQIVPVFSPAYQAEDVVRILDARQVRYVAVLLLGLTPTDPVLMYLGEHYRQLNDGLKEGLFLLERRD